MAKSNKRGSKQRLLTKDEIKRAGKYTGLGLNQKHIAALLEISVATLERRISDQPGVVEGIEKGRSEAAGAVTQSLFKQAMSGNVTAQIFWLKTQLRWRDKVEHEITMNHKPMIVEKLNGDQIVLGQEEVKVIDHD